MCKEVQSAIRSQQTGGASEAGTARAQENAEIESYMRDLDDAIARMDRELESGNYPDDEYNKRRGLLGDLTKKTGDLRKRRATRGGAKKSDLLGGQAGGGKGRGSRGPVKETSETLGMDDEDMVQVQEQVLKQQDQSLDAIHAQVRRVNMIAENIRDEGGLQDKLLDEIYDEQENVNAKMAKEQRLMEKVYRNSGNGKGMCLICLLVAAVVVVVLFILNN
jgi:hypothetical protein